MMAEEYPSNDPYYLTLPAPLVHSSHGLAMDIGEWLWIHTSYHLTNSLLVWIAIGY